jgi:uncharacterized protein (TIGR04255 family)
VNKSNKLPVYTKPPLNEVVSGLSFEKLPKLRTAYLGLLWERFSNDYPTTEDAPIFVLPRKDASPEIIDTLRPPRVWFVHKDENELIQVQQDWFIYNWRRQKGEDVYPHYEHVVGRLKECFGKFEEFLQERDMGPAVIKECMLTYINHIPIEEGWSSLQDLHDIFVDLSQPSNKERFLPTPSNIAWVREYPMPDAKGSLVAKLNTGIRRLDNKPVLILELSARGFGADGSGDAQWTWFDLAHEWIVRGFADLTTHEIQHKVWKLTNA